MDGRHRSSAPGGTDAAQVFSGTLVTRGTARGRVFATGERSALGRIGKSLEGIRSESTPIQRETRSHRQARRDRGPCAWRALSHWPTGCRAATGSTVYSPVSRSRWPILPEELPVVLTLFLSLGAWRLAREKVLARSIPAVELLGATTVLCVDKTGTLTANRMAVRRIWSEIEAYDTSRRGVGPAGRGIAWGPGVRRAGEPPSRFRSDGDSDQCGGPASPGEYGAPARRLDA